MYDQDSNSHNIYKSPISLSKNASESNNIAKKDYQDDSQPITDDHAYKLRRYIENLQQTNSDFSKIDDAYKSLSGEVSSFFVKIQEILNQDLYGSIFDQDKPLSPDKIFLKILSKIDYVLFFI